MRIDWTEEETKILLENYSTHTKKEIMEMFPNRKFFINLQKSQNIQIAQRQKY